MAAAKILTAEQIREIVTDAVNDAVNKAVRNAFHDAGLSIVEDDHIMEARRDFDFLRRWRKAIDGTASNIGYVILLTIVGGVLTAVWQGFKLLAGK